MKNQKPTTVSRGFTLVELLVVITIIITLAALSMVGITRMRKSADKVTAARNLSNLQLANTLYATDRSGRFVPTFSFDGKSKMNGQWNSNPDFLANYRGDGNADRTKGEAYNVPSSLLDPVAFKARKNKYKELQASFGYVGDNMPGGSWNNPDAAPSFSLGQLTAPERSAAFITSTDWNIKYSGRFLWQGKAAVEGGAGDGKIAYRHNKKALVAYYDGHVGEISIADLKAIDQQGGVLNSFWNAGAITP